MDLLVYFFTGVAIAMILSFIYYRVLGHAKGGDLIIDHGFETESGKPMVYMVPRIGIDDISKLSTVTFDVKHIKTQIDKK